MQSVWVRLCIHRRLSAWNTLTPSLETESISQRDHLSFHMVHLINPWSAPWRSHRLMGSGTLPAHYEHCVICNATSTTQEAPWLPGTQRVNYTTAGALCPA
ncbi:hypothetical protein FKM82_018320 [Ascaphus truei]